MTLISRFASAAVLVLCLLLAGAALARGDGATRPSNADGIVRVKSVSPLDETVKRLRADISSKGIMFFDEIDQSKLGATAGIKLRPSTLLVFGNPPLGVQFLTSNPNAGLDWPVRLLVLEDERGQVWAVYTDLRWIAQRHRIRDRQDAFGMASKVIKSITDSIAVKSKPAEG